MDKIDFLKENFFLFKNVSTSEINKIFSENACTEMHYCSGDIIQDNNSFDRIGIIFKGKAIIRSGVDGVIMNKLNVGDSYGAAALFDAPTHSTVVVASGECTVLTMDKNFIMDCITSSRQFSINYIEFLSKRINFLNKKINACTAKSAENKLYNYLLQLPRVGNSLSLNVDMSTIAKMLGIGRATLYRAFEKLENNGVITKSDKLIIFNEV